MPYYPQNATGLNYITYPVGPTTGGILTTSGSANTKGSYTQIVASSTFQSNAAFVNLIALLPSASAPGNNLLDIATGAGGSEVVVVPNIMFEMDSATSGTALFSKGSFTAPLGIASSTRIAARSQSSSSTIQVEFSLTLVAAGGVSGITTFTNDGANTGTSGGVSIDPGGTANTKGAYSQITASTTAVAQWIAVLLIHGSTTATSARWMVDLATGAAASEVVLIPDLAPSLGDTSNNVTFGAGAWPFLTYIASSTRIAARASCSTNAATSRLLQAAVLSAVAPAEPSGVMMSRVFAGA